MSMTGWTLYAPGDGWIEPLVNGPWTLEALTEPAGGWHGAFLVHSQEQPWEVERRLRTLGGHAAVPMLACYVETSDFGYALALLRGEEVARYVVNAHSAEHFVEGVWALQQCVALHGRDCSRRPRRRWPAGRALRPDRCPPSSSAGSWRAGTCFPSTPCSTSWAWPWGSRRPTKDPRPVRGSSVGCRHLASTPERSSSLASGPVPRNTRWRLVWLGGGWQDGGVPLPVPVVAAQRHGGQLLVGDLDAQRVAAAVQLGADRRPGRVWVAAISSTTTSWETSGRPRQFIQLWLNSRWLTLFHLEVPGGKWHTVSARP